MTRPDSQRVAVTGMGLVTPVGNDVPSSWSAILAGRSGIGLITQFDHSSFKTHIAAEVKNFDPTLYLDKKEARRMDRFLHFAAAAAQEAIADARLDMTYLHAAPRGRRGRLWDRWGPRIARATRHHERARAVAREPVYGAWADAEQCRRAHQYHDRRARPNFAIATACATGTHTIGEAAEIIRRGSADAMICGGSEAAIVPMAMAGFENMGAISSRNDEPERSSRPFDLHRDGFVMGEGAGILVLERLDLARARGARIYAELAGYGTTCDAYHVTAPLEDGSGAIDCMQIALQNAGLAPEAVQYINAHGTSTQLNDATETLAIKTVFGDHAYRLAASSTKSMTGHLMGAAGAIEGIFSVLALARPDDATNHQLRNAGSCL